METPIIDREIGKRVSQAKRAYTIYRNKHIELIQAEKAAEKQEIITQIEWEKRRLSIRVLKAQENTNRFVKGLNDLLIWNK